MLTSRSLLFALLALAPGASWAASQPPVRSTGGMVAADSAVASAAGAAMLAAGGDAVDAAVTTALVLGVVQPFASGIGGGGFAIVYRADGTALALDFREVAPAAADRDMYLDGKGEVIPEASTRGPRAAGVPGEVAGLYALHQRFGTRPWSEVVAPAVALARDGFPVGRLLHARTTQRQKLIAARPALARIYLDAGGQPWPVGHLLKRPDLARTLEAVGRQGPSALYGGEVGARLAAAMKADGGLVTLDDLKGYAPKERPLVRAKVMGFEVLSMPPPSSGGAVLVQVLHALEGVDLNALGHNSSAYLHRLAEALKHGFADRARVMGDPDFVDVPVAEMLSDATTARIKAAFRPDSTLPRGAYGGPYGVPEDGGTTHFSVLDARGNAVALTSTVNTSFGSGYVAGDTGILLNNQMDDFVAKPGVPNSFGLVGREANTIRPGKRPLSSMSPTIVLDEGGVRLVVGASGGPTIITGTVQVLLNVMVFGMDPRAAVEAPRIHHQWVPELLFVSQDLPRDVHEALKRRGHAVKPVGRFNAVQAIVRGDGWQEGASDPSKMGRPAGVGEIGR